MGEQGVVVQAVQGEVQRERGQVGRGQVVVVVL
jgi:hypothetical protein